jgi:uncharacterized integral membrane protein
MQASEPTQTPARTAPNQRAALQWALRLIPAALLLGFILINRQTVTVNFLLWQVQTSLIWALVVAAGLGLALGWLLRHTRRTRE